MEAGRTYDVAVIGGGIIGVATARALLQRRRLSLVVIEAEDRLAAHQTGNNSGVIHSGLYYTPGSLKARNCVEGRKALYRFCDERGIAHERCGKLVVATRAVELPRLEALEQRGRANGLRGLRRLAADEIAGVEPHARGFAALLVPETGIVDYLAVTEALADDVRQGGGVIRTGARMGKVERRGTEQVLHTSAGEVVCRNLVNCAGLQSDRVARLCGVRPPVRIIPFRGEYYQIRRERRELVRNLIYPVPDPSFPFLGVHFTRRVDGAVEAGPNAVLALRREGYERTSFSLGDALATFTYGGFWRLATRYWRTGTAEIIRSWSRSAFTRALQVLLPEIREEDLERGGAGVRAQALAGNGRLVDDFSIAEEERQIHVLNAPSPAATACLSIATTIADRSLSCFALS